MAFKINQNLTIAVGAFGVKAVDLLILKMVEEKLGRPVDWVNYTLVKEDHKKRTKTYRIIEACTYRDKDRGVARNVRKPIRQTNPRTPS